MVLAGLFVCAQQRLPGAPAVCCLLCPCVPRLPQHGMRCAPSDVSCVCLAVGVSCVCACAVVSVCMYVAPVRRTCAGVNENICACVLRVCAWPCLPVCVHKRTHARARMCMHACIFARMCVGVHLHANVRWGATCLCGLLYVRLCLRGAELSRCERQSCAQMGGGCLCCVSPWCATFFFARSSWQSVAHRSHSCAIPPPPTAASSCAAVSAMAVQLCCMGVRRRTHELLRSSTAAGLVSLWQPALSGRIRSFAAFRVATSALVVLPV